MCGISALIGLQPRTDAQKNDYRALLVRMSQLQRHRGPDWSGVAVQHVSLVGDFINMLGHERLAIVDPVGGAQPLTLSDKSVALTVNGEIYNHETIKAGLKDPSAIMTGSDCEAILHLYNETHNEVEIEHTLDGPHAYVLSDKKTGTVIVGRDPMGIMPMYWGHRKADNTVMFASELKGLHGICDEFANFPPGYVCRFQTGSGKMGVQAGMKRYYQPQWWDNSYLPSAPVDFAVLRSTFESAVKKRLMADVPFGVLLSGGLDSSLVASITSREFKKRAQNGATTSVMGNDNLHSFTIGLKPMAPPGSDVVPKTSPDIIAAREVATFLGTVHHEFEYTLEEGLDAISDVIRSMETYDVTTIRAGTPMYMLARRIKALGIKMVLSGEGADEVFGGYLYFHKAPNAVEFHKETILKLQKLHYYDVLRANKSTAAVGLEVRVPFLDLEFLEAAMAFDPNDKMIKAETNFIEKYAIRKAFDDEKDPYLPKSVLWRQKEQFSDGVGYGWIDGLKDHANKIITDDDLKDAKAEYGYNTPHTKEALWYRRLFNGHFPGKSAALTFPDDLASTVACSTAKALEWDEAFKNMQDPSGLAVASVHTAKRRKTSD